MKKGKVVATILLVIIVGVLMFIVGQYAASKTNYNKATWSDITDATNSTDNATEYEAKIGLMCMCQIMDMQPVQAHGQQH